ncbi:MAG: hypothetical protein HDT47_02585 [Ruminococcaceae bacterium]|nr:hypothetical protein [Oscillospiraceae bacterium]
MNKEDLIVMGLSEEQAKKVMDSLDGNYVTKARFNEVNEENKSLKQTVVDRDKQLEDLKKSSGDSAELKKQIEDLQQQNSVNKAAYEKEMAKLRLDNAVETALAAAGAKNVKAVRSLFDTDKLKLDDDGKVDGLEEQINAVKKSDPYMFAEKEVNTPVLRGFQPAASGDFMPNGKTDFSQMTYSEMTAYLAQNPDTKIQ